MLITLNQAEIESAIHNLVNEQVNIKDGHEITIELRAGRGPEGFTATIDIVPVQSTEAAPAKNLGLQEKVKAARQSVEPSKTEEPEEAGDVAEEDAQAVEGEEDAAPPTEAPQSLFKNLAKPRS